MHDGRAQTFCLYYTRQQRFWVSHPGFRVVCMPMYMRRRAVSCIRLCLPPIALQEREVSKFLAAHCTCHAGAWKSASASRPEAVCASLYLGCLPTVDYSITYPDRYMLLEYANVQELVDALQPAGQKLPVFIAGQSMGGMLAILTILRDQSQWQVGRACHKDLGLRTLYLSSLITLGSAPCLNECVQPAYRELCHPLLQIMQTKVLCWMH